MEEKIAKVAKAVQGLKYYEWCKVRVAIEKKYDSMSSKLELQDTESLERLLRLEFTGKTTL